VTLTVLDFGRVIYLPVTWPDDTQCTVELAERGAYAAHPGLPVGPRGEPRGVTAPGSAATEGEATPADHAALAFEAVAPPSSTRPGATGTLGIFDEIGFLLSSIQK
jgi:hypothetical protein